MRKPKKKKTGARERSINIKPHAVKTELLEKSRTVEVLEYCVCVCVYIFRKTTETNVNAEMNGFRVKTLCSVQCTGTF